MGYVSPPIKDLLNLATELKLFYNDGNAQRLEFINFYGHLIHHTTDHTLLVGACIYEMEIILKEYKGHDPKISKGYFYTTGSKIYSALYSKLMISDSNALNDDEKLIYLFKFYEYIKNKPADPILLGYENKDAYLGRIRGYLKEIKKREENRIDFLVYGIPKLEVLQRNIIQIMPDYDKATASRWLTNTKRRSLIDFIQLMYQSCETHSPLNTSLHDEKEFVYLNACHVLLGTLLFTMFKIKAEYTFFSPQHSELFKKCLEAMNAKNLEAIDRDKKILWLKALSLHIDYLNTKTASEKWVDKKWQLEIDKIIVAEEAKRITPSRPIVYATQATKRATHYGITMALTQVIKFFAMPALGGALVSGLTGPIGLVVYGAAGTLIMTQLGRLVRDNLMPPSVGFLYARVLEKIGNARGETNEAATYSFVASKEGFQALMGHPALSGEDKKFIYDWINTLLKMPVDIMSLQEKTQIRDVLGIQGEMDSTFLSKVFDDEKVFQCV